MTKYQILLRMRRYQDEVQELPPFKGRAAIIRNIQNQIDFLREHKTEAHLEQLMLKDCVRKVEGVRRHFETEKA